MSRFTKRLLLIFFIIFIPAFFTSLFSSFFIHLLFISGFADNIPSNWDHLFLATISLYKAYMTYLWELLVITAIGIDVYFYMLKGYMRNSLFFYGLKSFFTFLILYFSTILYFEDSFGILESSHLGVLPSYAYAILFVVGILFSMVCIFSVHALHRKWIFPHYRYKIQKF